MWIEGQSDEEIEVIDITWDYVIKLQELVSGLGDVNFKYGVGLKRLEIIFYIMHALYFQTSLMIEAFLALIADVLILAKIGWF
jgi:hypothetical protein